MGQRQSSEEMECVNGQATGRMGGKSLETCVRYDTETNKCLGVGDKKLQKMKKKTGQCKTLYHLEIQMIIWKSRCPVLDNTGQTLDVVEGDG